MMRTHLIIAGIALLQAVGVIHTRADESTSQPLGVSEPPALTAEAVQAGALEAVWPDHIPSTYSASRSGHPMEGQKAPPINLKDVDGKPIQVGQVKADVFVLDFWATWCPPCRKGLPLLQQFQDWVRQNKKPVAVLTINLKESPRKVRQFWKDQKFTMPVLMDSEGDTARAYGVQGIPQTVIIHQGQIVTVHVGYSPNMTEMLKAEVEQLLSKDKN